MSECYLIRATTLDGCFTIFFVISLPNNAVSVGAASRIFRRHIAFIMPFFNLVHRMSDPFVTSSLVIKSAFLDVWNSEHMKRS